MGSEMCIRDSFKLVTWPMLGPTHVFVITISSIRSFQVFDTVEALTEGEPSVMHSPVDKIDLDKCQY